MNAWWRDEPNQPSPGLRTSDIVIVYFGFDVRRLRPTQTCWLPGMRVTWPVRPGVASRCLAAAVWEP